MNRLSFFGHSGRSLILHLAAVMLVVLALDSGCALSGNKYGETRLHWAADNDHKAIAEVLLSDGADVNATNNFSQTALRFAEDTDCSGGKNLAELLRQHGGHE